MPLNTAMWSMTGAEFLLWVTLAILFWRKELQRRFRAMGYYLALRAVAMPILLLLLYELAHAGSRGRYAFLYRIYSVDFYVTYLAAALLLFFICVEVFRAALAPFPGVAKLAIVIFRLAALVAVVVGISSAFYNQKNPSMLMSDVANSIMRSISALELCLLIFLCLSMKSLRLSVRDLSFGIAFGFGIMASGDLIAASLSSHLASLNDPIQFVYEGMILLSLAIWGTYSLLPEPAPKPILVPASSTIYRWNEIASALGHGTRVAVQQPANGFFLSDVERVVEKVLAKNMKDSESET